MTAINIDAASISPLLAKAIIETLPEQTRDDVLAQAVQHLVAPIPRNPNSFGRDPDEGKSPLQVAFERALDQAAHGAARKAIDEDDVLKSKIDAMVGSVVSGLMEEDHSYGLTETVGRQIGVAVAQYLRERNN